MEEQKLYDCDYSQPSGTVKLYKYDIPLPKRPPLKEMENYGLPIKEQKFRRTPIPKSLLQRKQHLTPEESLFIKNEHHKRKNGVWMIIKGIPVYITGPYYFFLNYWWTKDSVHPTFRYIQCLIFLLWNMVVRDPDSYGLNLVGPRRIGKTEFTLAEVYEYITRVKNTNGHMQSKNDDTAYKNFKRITKANKKMIWFMKPISKGSDDPEGALEFKYPMVPLTDKRIKELANNPDDEADNPYSEEEMGSKIDYQPSVSLAYDGQETNRGILNEAAKLDKMSLLDWWDKFKSTCHYNAGKLIVAKVWVESTVEELDGDQIEEVNTFWRDSDPNERDKNGRTTNGLYHLFISHLEAFDEDEWGFSMPEEAERFLDNQIKNLEKKKKFTEIADLLRKYPRTIEDALTPSGAQSAFNKDRLQEILKRIDFPESFGLPPKEWTVKGNFMWANGTWDTTVVFIPDENGKFEVSQLLKNGEDNNVIHSGGIRYPGNLHKYRGGCDPYEHSEVVDQNRASKGAGVIFRLFDDNVDGAKIMDGAPIDFGWEWESKQPVCDYLEREDDPDVFFEDMLMMHVYYGTQMNVENNKQSIKKHFRQRGYAEFLMARPESTMDEKSRYATTNQIGTPATTDTIDQYFMAIAHYVMMYANAMKHRRIILQLLEGNKKNRGKLDLLCAYGWGLIGCEKQFSRLPEHETESTKDDWFVMHRV